MPAVDAVTNPKLAYIRMHGRNTEGYLTGKSVAERFDWDYTEDELKEIGSARRHDGRAGAARSTRCSTTTAAPTPRAPRSASAT